MKKRLVVASLLALGHGVPAASAAPGTVSGSPALALAGVLAPQSPALSSADRRNMGLLFAGFPITARADHKFSVAARSIDCRISTTDIAVRTCDISFEDRRHPPRRLSWRGRAANELFATLTTARIAPEGDAAPTSFKLNNLVCTVDPNEIRRRTGGGADCTFETG